MNHTKSTCVSALTIFGLIAVMALVGDGDYEEAQNQLKYYCKMVEEGSWPDYNHLHEQGKCPQEGQAMTEQEQAEQIEKVNAASLKWDKAKKALDAAKDAESSARAELVKAAFPGGLKEGTNTFDLAGKWKLKVQGKISREIDKAALSAVLERMEEKFQKKFDGLVKYSPELSVSTYKTLDDKERKMFDNALTIKGTDQNSPQVKIEEAKR